MRMNGGGSAPASRTGWGQLNATPEEAICSYKTGMTVKSGVNVMPSGAILGSWRLFWAKCHELYTDGD